MTMNDSWKLGLFPLTLSGVLLGMHSVQTIGLPAADPIVYRLAPASRFEVRTGKSGLFGFAGHSHEVRADAVDGWVVYNPEHPTTSRLEVRVPTESLQVLTPSDTAEIRKVTERMRSDVCSKYHGCDPDARSLREPAVRGGTAGTPTCPCRRWASGVWQLPRVRPSHHPPLPRPTNTALALGRVQHLPQPLAGVPLPALLRSLECELVLRHEAGVFQRKPGALPRRRERPSHDGVER
jgi:hypothetical protein